MAWCSQCTCCEVRRTGDLCIFCEDGILCPRRRNKQRLAKAAAAILQPKTADPLQSRAEEERAIRKTARDVDRRHQREERQKLREARRHKSSDRILAERQAKELARAEKKLKRASENFVARVAATEIPPERRCKDCSAAIAKANYCRPCLSKRRRRPHKYVFTPEMDQRVAEMYAQRLTKRFSLKGTLAKEFGVPDWAITKRGRELGLARTKEKPWSTAERDLLEEHGWKSDDTISSIFYKLGYHRSPTAIHVMLARHPKGKRELYPFWSAVKAAKLFGIDAHSIGAWIDKGWLRASRRATDRTAKQGGDPWAIYPYDVYQFIKEHPTEFDIRKVDQFWFVELLTDESKRREPDRFDPYSSSYLPYSPNGQNSSQLMEVSA